MGFIIALIISVLVMVVFGILFHKAIIEELAFFLSAFFGAAACIFLLLCIGLPCTARIGINAFEAQKAYIEEHAGTAYEDAGLTSAKIAQNQWLFEKQSAAKAYPFFVFYADEILELEPIK